MKKLLTKVSVFLGLIFTMGIIWKMPAEAHTTGYMQWRDGAYRMYDNTGTLVVNDFVFDGVYTYYAQADGTPMKDRLTYHPDGEHIIYFDSQGHEVFNAFQYCPSVGYTCYFDSQGYIYKDQITFYGDEVYYLNANGKMEDCGWFQFANGRDYGYAYADGSLKNEGFDYDGLGRVVFYHWNGMAARGLITDNYWYYHFDDTDGHYLGRFRNYGQPDAYSMERQVLDLVNDERLSRGIAPLFLDSQACQAAQLRAVEIAGYFSHTRPDGRSCFTALDDMGIAYGAAGENIAAGYSSPQAVMTGWMNSPGHRENILDPSFRRFALGYYQNFDTDYGHHWVQMFMD